jgi:phosphoglycerate dehydrogenase-like enzyme
VSEWSLDSETPFVRYGGPELFGKTLGPVGFGTIGREVARIARGFQMNSAALHAALSEHRIAGAAIDVYELEPVPADDPLLRLENVLLTSHLAGTAWDISRHHSEMLIRDLTLFFAGRCPEHLANPEVWEQRRRAVAPRAIASKLLIGPFAGLKRCSWTKTASKRSFLRHS